MIVAIESSSIDLSVAVADPEGGSLLETGWDGGQRHASDLLPRLTGLASQLGRPLGAARMVAVGIGPGSFTGLRVGMSVAKGIAFAAGCPIIGVPSLAAWLAAEPDAEMAIGRGGLEEVYLLVRGGTEPSLLRFDEVPARARDALVVAPSEVAAALGIANSRPPHHAAAALIREAASRLERGDPGDDLEALEPAYLRQPRGVEAAQRGAVRCG